MDAPRVAGHLMKHGADISQEVDDYPDLTPLCLALGRYRSSDQKELDTALRIACSYALPRTARFLLAGGADVNTMSTYGVAAVHSAVVKRARWRDFDCFHKFLNPHAACDDPASLWESAITQTVAALLDFGADIRQRTRTTRSHRCDFNCWRSVSCDQRGQTPLHLASASGLADAVSILLSHGASAESLNDDGCTPLYGALVQGSEEAAQLLLQCSDGQSNPIVDSTRGSTALHVACRFAFSQVASRLLEDNADPNTVDCEGRTPLHEVLSQTRLDRQEESITTLQHLASFGAYLDLQTACAQTPRQMAEKHTSPWVRDLPLWRDYDPNANRPEESCHDPWGTSSSAGNNQYVAGEWGLRPVWFPAFERQVAAENWTDEPAPEFNSETFPGLAAPSTAAVVAAKYKPGTLRTRDGATKRQATPNATAQATKQAAPVLRITDVGGRAPSLPLGTPKTGKGRQKGKSSGAIPPAWSKGKTSQMMKALGTPSTPPRKSIQQFPALGKKQQLGGPATSAIHASTTSPWGGLARKTEASPTPGRAKNVEGSVSAEKQSQAVDGPKKAGGEGRKKKWQPLQL